MSSLSLLSLRLFHAIFGRIAWWCFRTIGYSYPVSIRINQKGGIYFLAREAYFQGDEVVLLGVVRAASRYATICDEWPKREETSRVEPLKNVVPWTAWGFSPARNAEPRLTETVPVRRRPIIRKELVTEQA